jgi:DNA polymerase-3 subunit gamma/tau
MPVLPRAWQMLLKGDEEVRAAPRPLAAADMVLVRIAYAADLPTPSDLKRHLPDDARAGSGEKGRSVPAHEARKPAEAEALLQEPAVEVTRPAPAESNNPKRFDELVALADQKRDLKLKHALLEQVRLVRFRPGHLEINPLPTAPKELGQELMRKLKAWTGRVWIVAVSADEGAAPLGAQRRAREASEIERIRQHPDVRELLQHFPDARIAAVRPLAGDAQGDGEPDSDDDMREDGTN